MNYSKKFSLERVAIIMDHRLKRIISQIIQVGFILIYVLNSWW